MTPENENAYPPKAEDADTRSVHPSTEDEPTATGSAESGPITEDLAPEDEPHTGTPSEEPPRDVPGGHRVSVGPCSATVRPAISISETSSPGSSRTHECRPAR